MSLHPPPIDPIPEQTVRVARAAFPRGTPYLRRREAWGVFSADEDEDEAFAARFSARGQPAASPWRLALVLVLP
jgi:transposase